MGSIKSGIYGMVRWRGTMPEFELRFRLHCDVGGEQRYGWEQLQTRMKTGYSERLLQIWADVLYQRGVGKKEDRVIFVCLEGGICVSACVLKPAAAPPPSQPCSC